MTVRINLPTFKKLRRNDISRQILKVAGFDLVKETKQLITQRTSGRVYYVTTRGGKRKKRVAGKIGYPPNSQTGALRSSIEFSFVNDKLIAVGSGLQYAKDLEEGLHPFLAPALDNRTEAIRQLVEDAYRGIIESNT